jgi:hypothetical protein
MTDKKNKDEGDAGGLAKNSGTDPRQDRLKRALRENLKRRKSQAKGRGDITVAPSNRDHVSPHDGNGKKTGE